MPRSHVADIACSSAAASKSIPILPTDSTNTNLYEWAVCKSQACNVRRTCMGSNSSFADRMPEASFDRRKDFIPDPLSSSSILRFAFTLCCSLF